jgi:hypothetical protein
MAYFYPVLHSPLSLHWPAETGSPPRAAQHPSCERAVRLKVPLANGHAATRQETEELFLDG